jgi:hypothetical protein
LCSQQAPQSQSATQAKSQTSAVALTQTDIITTPQAMLDLTDTDCTHASAIPLKHSSNESKKTKRPPQTKEQKAAKATHATHTNTHSDNTPVSAAMPDKPKSAFVFFTNEQKYVFTALTDN